MSDERNEHKISRSPSNNRNNNSGNPNINESFNDHKQMDTQNSNNNLENRKDEYLLKDSRSPVRRNSNDEKKDREFNNNNWNRDNKEDFYRHENRRYAPKERSREREDRGYDRERGRDYNNYSFQRYENRRGRGGGDFYRKDNRYDDFNRDKDRYRNRDFNRDMPHHHHNNDRDFRNRRSPYRNNRSRSPRFMKKQSRENSAENKGKFISYINNLKYILIYSEGTCVHVSNLPKIVKEHELEEIFREFGEIKNINVVTEPSSKECRGFAFITFDTPNSAEESIKKLSGFEFSGKKLICQIAKRNKARSSTPGMYLGSTSLKKPSFRGRYDRPRYGRRPYRSRSRSHERGHHSNNNNRRYDNREHKSRDRSSHNSYLHKRSRSISEKK